MMYQTQSDKITHPASLKHHDLYYSRSHRVRGVTYEGWMAFDRRCSMCSNLMPFDTEAEAIAFAEAVEIEDFALADKIGR
jgi:hypothetical protein